MRTDGTEDPSASALSGSWRLLLNTELKRRVVVGGSGRGSPNMLPGRGCLDPERHLVANRL